MSFGFHRATPLRRSQIRGVAHILRDKCGFRDEPWLPIVEVMERALDVFAPNFVWDIASERELGLVLQPGFRC